MFQIKEIYKKPVSILLSLFILLTSFGIQLDFHFCQDELKSFSIMGTAKTCYELAGYENPIEKDTQNKELKKERCCGFLHIDCTLDSEIITSGEEENQVQRIKHNLDFFENIKKVLIPLFDHNIARFVSGYEGPPLLNKPDIRDIQVFRF